MKRKKFYSVPRVSLAPTAPGDSLAVQESSSSFWAHNREVLFNVRAHLQLLNPQIPKICPLS